MARRVPFKFGQCEPTSDKTVSERRHGGAIRRRAVQFSAPSFELEQLPREVATVFTLSTARPWTENGTECPISARGFALRPLSFSASVKGPRGRRSVLAPVVAARTGSTKPSA